MLRATKKAPALRPAPFPFPQPEGAEDPGGSEDLAEGEEHAALADALAAIGAAGDGDAFLLVDVGAVPGQRAGEAGIDLARDADRVPEVVGRAEARVVLDPLVADAAGAGDLERQGDVDAAFHVVAGAGAAEEV